MFDDDADDAGFNTTGLLILLLVGAVLAGAFYGYPALRALARTNPEAATSICYGIVLIPGVPVWIWILTGWYREAQNQRNKTSSDLPVASSRLSKPEQSRSRAYAGHVYLIREEFGTYKIGRTKDVPNRYNTLKIQIPQPIEVVWSIK